MANNRWTNFVREWAVKNGLSYGCALSDPAMRDEYKAKYGNRKRLTQTKEKEMMGQEDKDAIELVIEEVAPKKGKKGRPAKYATAEEARQAKIKNTIEARKRKKQGQNEVLSEAKEAIQMGKEDINRSRKKVMRPPSGPPPISAETLKAVKAKVATDKTEEYKVNAVRTKMTMTTTMGVEADRFFKFLIKEAEKQGQSSPRYVARLVFNTTGGTDFGDWFALDNDKDEVREALGENMSIKLGEFEVRGDEETTTITPDLLKLIKSAQKKGFIDVEYDFIKRIADVSNKGARKMMRPFEGKGFNPLPEFAEQVEGAESGGGIQHLDDGCVLYTGGKKKFNFLDSVTKIGKTLGKPFEKKVGVNPFTLGYDFGEKVVAPALMKIIPPKGGHWTEQMKPHLEKELRNYQNIVHHLGQHLSESGPKDPKDAMGYSHYGNEMRRIKQLLSTI